MSRLTVVRRRSPAPRPYEPDVPVYGHICLTCGQTWPHDAWPGKHIDPATDAKCRDVTGSAASPVTMSPVATRPWGPEGAIANLRWEAEYDHGSLSTIPSRDQIELFMRDGVHRLEHVLSRRIQP